MKILNSKIGQTIAEYIMVFSVVMAAVLATHFLLKVRLLFLPYFTLAVNRLAIGKF